MSITFRTISLFLELLVQFGHMTNPGPSSSGTNYFWPFCNYPYDIRWQLLPRKRPKNGQRCPLWFPKLPSLSKKCTRDFCWGYFHLSAILWDLFNRLLHLVTPSLVSYYNRLTIWQWNAIFSCKSNNLFAVILQQTALKFDAAAPLPCLFHEL